MDVDYLPVVLDPLATVRRSYSLLHQIQANFLNQTRKVIIRLNYYGTIWAGWPSPAEEELVDVISLDEYLISNPTATMIVRIKSDALEHRGIHKGDLVLVERGRKPSLGDLILAEVENEWKLLVLSTFREEIVLKGVVVAVIRKYH